MRKLRALAYVLLLVTLLASCGRNNDIEADRVIGSPSARPSPTLSSEETSRPSATGRAGATVSSAEPTSYATKPTPAGEGTAAPGNLAAARVKLTKVVSIDDPVAMAIRRGDGALYIAQRHEGTIRPVRSGNVGAPVLDISNQISTGGEQGLLGLTFSPDGRKLYVNFTNTSGDTVVREYAFTTGRATSPRNILEIDQPEANHNGGNLAFGPDGYLYIGMGDGGGGGDAHGAQGNGQNLETLLGKMLRIRPTPSGSPAYTSPSSNPFVGRTGRDEIWAYGLRNPWRWSFDRSTKDLWIADVGQQQWEEVNFASYGGDGGDNYGWRRMEGTHSFAGGTPPANHHAPIYEYSHDGGNCSVTGGYVYRGSRIPNLVGAYVFGDYCAGRLRAFKRAGGSAAGHRFLGPQVGQLSSFGQDVNGELYVLSLDGALYRIDPA
jgi:glucose/arabinose dehydrogenase